jgi:hypothetical protein
MQGDVDEAELTTIGYMHTKCVSIRKQPMSQIATVIPSLLLHHVRNFAGYFCATASAPMNSQTKSAMFSAERSLWRSLSGRARRKVWRLGMRVLAKNDHGDLMVVTCVCRVMLTILNLRMRLLKKRTASCYSLATVCLTTLRRVVSARPDM